MLYRKFLNKRDIKYCNKFSILNRWIGWRRLLYIENIIMIIVLCIDICIWYELFNIGVFLGEIDVRNWVVGGYLIFLFGEKV